MKVQIFGSEGYIGKNFVKYLSDIENIELELFDVHEKSFFEDLKYTQIDIAGKSIISKIKFDSDFIFIFSGLTGTSVGFSKYEDYIKVNELGLLNILNSLKEQNYKGRIVFPSTRLVYKGVKNTPLKEGDEKEFKTPYAINKYACEEYLKMYNNLYGLNFTVFRICVPYGSLVSGAYSYGTIGFFLSRASKGENISLYGDGTQKRTFTHVHDISKMLWQGSNNDKCVNSVFNIGGETLSIYDSAKTVADKFNVKVELTDWPEIDLKLESGDTIFESEKLDGITGESYKYKFYDWVKSLK